MIDRDGGLGERQGGQRVILRQLEAQRRRRRRRRLGRSVRYSEPASLDVMRRAWLRIISSSVMQIALGRERDADARQLGELAMALAPDPRRARRSATSDAAWRNAPRSIADERSDGRVAGQIAVEQVEGKVGRRLVFARIADPDERGAAREVVHARRVAAGAREQRAVEHDDRGSCGVDAIAVGRTGTRRSSTSSSLRPSGEEERRRPTAASSSGLTNAAAIEG